MDLREDATALNTSMKWFIYTCVYVREIVYILILFINLATLSNKQLMKLVAKVECVTQKMKDQT